MSQPATPTAPDPQSGGRADIEALQARCAAEPGRPEPLMALAEALLAAGRAAEAVVPTEQAAALAPQSPAAAQLRETVTATLLAGDPALVRLELTAALQPADAAAQLVLGEAYAALGRPHDAERCFKRALVLGRVLAANAELATVYLSVGMLEAAEHHGRLALAADDGADETSVVMACQSLAAVAEARGDLEARAGLLDRAYARRSLFRQPAPEARFTTLVLLTREAGNVDFKSLLPPLKFDCAVWYMEHARSEQFAELPDHAVVLNAIGDPDLGLDSEAMVDAFLAGCDKPVLNRPERVRATFRHRLAETLAGIDDLVVPRTERLPAQAIAEAGGLAAAAKRFGLSFPLLARPAGRHGGQGLTLADGPAALAEMAIDPNTDYYLSAFHDYRSPDGFYRKYRMIFVDRRAFAYHLAIGRGWMVHHQSTDMGEDAARMAEEMAFLHDPAGVLGPRALAAIEAVGRRLDLDYGGIDFTLTPDGGVLVFEANATMLAHLEPEDGPFAAKNPFIRPIGEAFQARLAALAGFPGL